MNGTTTIQVCGQNLEWQPTQGIVTCENLPTMMMWIDTTLAGLMAGIQAMVGTDRFCLALQSQGRKSAQADWQVISQFEDFRTGFESLNSIAKVAGWGSWELISLDWETQQCCFQIENSWEGLYQKTLGVCWGSSFLAGKLAGYAGKLFETHCDAEQTAFIARGDKFDEFVVKPSKSSIAEQIDRVLVDGEATCSDMAVALENLKQEVAKRQQAEETLRHREQLYRSLVLATSQIVWITDGQGKVIDMPAWREYTGQSKEEVQGWGWLEAIHPDDRASTAEVWLDALANKTLYNT